MALNAGIILQGQNIDVVGAMDRGAIAGQRANEFSQQNALNGFLQQSGGDVMRGDSNALNQLAQFGTAGLNAAQGVQGNQLNMDQTRLGMDAMRQNMAQSVAQEGRLDRQEQMQIQQYAASLSADQAAQAQQKIAAGMPVLATAQDPQSWDQIAQQLGQPDLVGQFGQRDRVFAQFQTLGDVLASQQAPTAQSGIGKFYADQAAGLIPVDAQPPQTGTSVTVNNAPEVGVTDDFYKNVDKGQADMYVGLVNEGVSAPAKLAQIDQLEALLDASPSGAEAAFKSFLGGYGIATAGLDTLQAANAIISQLVPSQRPPGSGTMSDADLALFKQSLPRLINTPQGNKTIVSAIRGIAVYQQKQGEIANAVISRRMTPSEGRDALMQLQNPLEVIRREGATTISGTYTFNPETGELE